MTANRATRKRRRINGDGSIYKRKDGYWAGAYYTGTTSGASKRVVVYGKTYEEARDKLAKAQHQARAGIRAPDSAWALGPYLQYWLENSVKRNRRPATYALYEMTVRLYLLPGLGNKKLTNLSVAAIQDFLNMRLEHGDSVRKVQIMRTVLSAALTRAMREELIVRNPARLVELPEWRRAPIRPWTADEARQFLTAARPDPLYSAFLLLVFYGLRLGEVLGLGWDDIDFDGGKVVVRQQLQRIRGEIFLAPVKTHAGNRALPLLDLAQDALKSQAERQVSVQEAMGSAWPDTRLIFTTKTGRPVEPRNLERSFRRICENNGVRIIKVHHVRHTVGSLLKDLGVPARDAQAILGHTRISTTLEIYTDTDEQARRNALTRLRDLLDQTED